MAMRELLMAEKQTEMKLPIVGWMIILAAPVGFTLGLLLMIGLSIAYG